MSSINNTQNIFVLCPSGMVSGGPDALHQLVYYLNLLGKKAQICYLLLNKNEKVSIPAPYLKYVKNFCVFNSDIDEENNIIIIPETATFLISKVKKAQIIIWWLSVDNNLTKSSFFYKIFFILTLPIRLIKNKKYYEQNKKTKIFYTLLQQKYNFKKEQKNIYHACASYYAFDFVSKQSKNNCYLLIEPISKIFLENYKKEKFKKEDIIIYNPIKCGKFVKKLIKRSQGSLQFLPLKNLKQSELINYYKKAKLYIDFGPFPGAERMPKEAVLFGCVVLTGIHGASNYFCDVPILSKYKINEKKYTLDFILEKIKEALSNYDEIVSDFSYYRSVVINLESNFLKSLTNFEIIR